MSSNRNSRKALKYGVAGVAIGLLSATLAVTPAWADFDDGLKAYADARYESAVDTWRRHAIAGDVKSKQVLGDVFSGKAIEADVPLPLPEKTSVIQRDDVEALAWYILAAHHDFKSYNQNPTSREVNAKYIAQERIPVLKKRMTDAGVRQAQKRVVEILSAESQFDLYRLGMMYQMGAGLPKDNVEALKFFELAKGRKNNSNSEASKAAGALMVLMSQKEIEVAQELALNWQPPLPEALNSKTPKQLELEEEIKRLKSIQLAEALSNIEEEFDGNENLLQSALAALGFYQGEIDGKIGRESRVAIRSFQYSLVQDNKDMTMDEKRRVQTGTLSPEQKVELIKRASKREHPQSMYVFGLMHAEGIGVPINGQKSIEWLNKSANYGYALAHYALGSLYRDGIVGEDPVDPDATEATFHFGQAYALGVPEAQNELMKLRYDFTPATNERGSHEN